MSIQDENTPMTVSKCELGATVYLAIWVYTGLYSEEHSLSARFLLILLAKEYGQCRTASQLSRWLGLSTSRTRRLLRQLRRENIVVSTSISFRKKRWYGWELNRAHFGINCSPDEVRWLFEGTSERDRLPAEVNCRKICSIIEPEAPTVLRESSQEGPEQLSELLTRRENQ